MSLRLRLTLIYSLFVAIILGVVAVSVYELTENSLTAAIEDRGLEALAAARDENYFGARSRLPGESYLEFIFYLPILNDLDDGSDLRDGYPHEPELSLQFNPTDDSVYTRLSDSELDRLLAGDTIRTRVTLDGGRRLFVLASMGTITRPTAVYPGLLLVGIPASNVESQLDLLRRDLLSTVIVAFVFFAIGVWLLSSRALLPVQRVTRAAARIGGQDLSQRVPVPSTRDEMHELAVTINHMLDRLQESFETQRRFTADASHELRTPVTAIVGHANYILRRTKPSGEQVDSLTVIRREAERMAKLVNDLLELARADAGFTVDREPMNLVEVVEAMHMEVAPVAGSAEITVSSPQPLVEVLGDESRLKQVVLNLVQNALNAGATIINISLTKEKHQARLEVLDNGPGIPPEAIPHLFDRFYRVDGARSTRGNGSGLGLAIVRWIVQQHDGEVSVESKVGEGTVITVLLPLLDAKKTAQAPVSPARARTKVTSS